MTRTDILLTNNDIQITDNDLVIAESDEQHIADTINACPGWWKESYSEGVAIMKYLKGRNVQQELSRSMKLQLTSDQYNSRPIINYDTAGNLQVNPNVTL